MAQTHFICKNSAPDKTTRITQKTSHIQKKVTNWDNLFQVAFKRFLHSFQNDLLIEMIWFDADGFSHFLSRGSKIISLSVWDEEEETIFFGISGDFSSHLRFVCEFKMWFKER